MYGLVTADGTLYADSIRYIRVHENGCYVECSRAKAEGICAKVHETQEDGSETLTVTVFALKEGALHGTEPLCLSIISEEEIEQMKLAETEEILRILGGETV